EEGSGNFYIKDLLVQETNFSNLSLSKTRFKSSRTKQGIEYKFINDDLSGILLVPEDNQRNLSFKFDFIKINQSSSGSKDSFLYLYNGISDEFDFSAEKIFFNGKNYGNWEFSIFPENNQLALNGIKGTYGRWSLKNTNQGISSLRIVKNSIGWTTSLKTKIYSGSPEKAMIQIGIKPNFELDTLSLDTDLSWNNLPWLFDYNSITGEVSANLEGLTIKNSEDLEATNNVLRLVNIFNITDSFEKVTNLDFRKLYKRGFSADSVKGKFRVTDKSLQIKEPILLKSGSSQFKWTGEISRDKKGNLDRLNLEVIMTLPLREYLPAYALVLGGPITAGVVYIAGKAFERNLDKLSSGKWMIKGNISEPETEFDGWFEDSTEE
ncbi:MAG: AsmA-like C-terminal region-containing protein, partial [Gammaproteobacteria bacterium]